MNYACFLYSSEVSSGRLLRSFRNVPKAASSQGVLGGICHLCRAGQPNFDYEDLQLGRVMGEFRHTFLRSPHPAFVRTLNEQLPWRTESVLTTGLMHEADRKAEYYKVDVFHTVSLGVGKLFCASALAVLQSVFRGASLDARFREMSVAYLEFCKDAWLPFVVGVRVLEGQLSQENQKNNFVQKIDRVLLGWVGASESNGAWSKGALTTTLSQFLEHLSKVYNLENSGDERISLIVFGLHVLLEFPP